jgi:hypothetical protein
VDLAGFPGSFRFAVKALRSHFIGRSFRSHWRSQLNYDFIVSTGTTVKGAVDDLDLILKVLERVGYTEDRFYIHVDGALFGLMMPFVKKVSTLNISHEIIMSRLEHEQYMKCYLCHVELSVRSKGKVIYYADHGSGTWC